MRAQESQRLRVREAEAQVESLEGGSGGGTRASQHNTVSAAVQAVHSGATNCHLLLGAAASYSCWLT